MIFSLYPYQFSFIVVDLWNIMPRLIDIFTSMLYCNMKLLWKKINKWRMTKNHLLVIPTTVFFFFFLSLEMLSWLLSTAADLFLCSFFLQHTYTACVLLFSRWSRKCFYTEVIMPWGKVACCIISLHKQKDANWISGARAIPLAREFINRFTQSWQHWYKQIRFLQYTILLTGGK